MKRTLYLLSKVFQLLASVNMTFTPNCAAWSSTKSSPLNAVSLYRPAPAVRSNLSLCALHRPGVAARHRSGCHSGKALRPPSVLVASWPLACACEACTFAGAAWSPQAVDALSASRQQQLAGVVQSWPWLSELAAPARGCSTIDRYASWPCPNVRTSVSPLLAAAWKVKRTASGPVRFVSASKVNPAPHSIMSHLRMGQGASTPRLSQSCNLCGHFPFHAHSAPQKPTVHA